MEYKDHIINPIIIEETINLIAKDGQSGRHETQKLRFMPE